MKSANSEGETKPNFVSITRFLPDVPTPGRCQQQPVFRIYPLPSRTGSQQSHQHTLHPQVPPRPGFTKLKCLVVVRASFTSLGNTIFFRFCISDKALESEHRQKCPGETWGGIVFIRMWPWPSFHSPAQTSLVSAPVSVMRRQGSGLTQAAPWHEGPEAGERPCCLCDPQRGLELVSGQQRSACPPCVCRVCAFLGVAVKEF